MLLSGSSSVSATATSSIYNVAYTTNQDYSASLTLNTVDTANTFQHTNDLVLRWASAGGANAGYYCGIGQYYPASYAVWVKDTGWAYHALIGPTAISPVTTMPSISAANGDTIRCDISGTNPVHVCITVNAGTKYCADDSVTELTTGNLAIWSAGATGTYSALSMTSVQ